jgi:hypothetical protein
MPAPASFPAVAQAFLLESRGQYRCRNVIVHPNGHLYGDAQLLGCSTWCSQENRMYFVDFMGRVRLDLAHAENGSWKYQAPRLKSSAERIRKNALLLGDRGWVTVATPSVDYRLLPQAMPPDKKTFEIVVAKYREDVAWIDAVAANVTLYSKDAADTGKYPVLANLGREGGTYLHHIVNHYDDLADRTLFLQGDPFPHPLLALVDYTTDPAPFTCAACECSHIEDPIPWSSPLQRIDRPPMEAFLRLIECDPNMTSFQWVQGAQFASSREQIRRRPLDYYRRLWEVTQQEWVTLGGRQFDNHHVAWLFELFWRYVFSVAG